MFRRALLIGLIGLVPGVVWAQSQPLPPARTTPAEVAAAMLPCLKGAGFGSLTTHGTLVNAWVTMPDPGEDVGLFSLYRDAGEVLDQSRREAYVYYWIDHDPIDPPLVLHFTEAWAHSYNDRYRFVGCFTQVYPLR